MSTVNPVQFISSSTSTPPLHSIGTSMPKVSTPGITIGTTVLDTKDVPVANDMSTVNPVQSSLSSTSSLYSIRSSMSIVSTLGITSGTTVLDTKDVPVAIEMSTVNQVQSISSSISTPSLYSVGSPTPKVSTPGRTTGTTVLDTKDVPMANEMSM